MSKVRAVAFLVHEYICRCLEGTHRNIPEYKNTLHSFFFWALNSSKIIGLKKSVCLLQTLCSYEYHHCTTGDVVWSKSCVCLNLSFPWRCFKCFVLHFQWCSGFSGGKCRGILKVEPRLALVGAAASVTIQRPSSANVEISFLHHHCFKSKTQHFPPESILCAECWEVLLLNTVLAHHCWISRGKVLHEPEGCSDPCPQASPFPLASKALSPGKFSLCFKGFISPGAWRSLV